MSIQQIEEAIKGLSTAEIETLRGWIEEYLEDEREVTTEFAASTERGKRDIAEDRTRITEDELAHAEKEVQKKTNEYIKEIDAVLANKEKDVLAV